MSEFTWLKPWVAADRHGIALVSELNRELNPTHILFEMCHRAIGRRIDCDDVLFECTDGTFALVHLTWLGKKDLHPDFPWTRLFLTFEEFTINVMIPDSNDFCE